MCNLEEETFIHTLRYLAKTSEPGTPSTLILVELAGKVLYYSQVSEEHGGAWGNMLKAVGPQITIHRSPNHRHICQSFNLPTTI